MDICSGVMLQKWILDYFSFTKGEDKTPEKGENNWVKYLPFARHCFLLILTTAVYSLQKMYLGSPGKEYK